MTDDVSTAEARKRLADLVNRVAYGGESVVLTRHGKRVAALVPVEDLSLLDRLRAAAGTRDVAEALAELAEGSTVDWPTLRAELGLDE